MEFSKIRDVFGNVETNFWFPEGDIVQSFRRFGEGNTRHDSCKITLKYKGVNVRFHMLVNIRIPRKLKFSILEGESNFDYRGISCPNVEFASRNLIMSHS